MKLNNRVAIVTGAGRGIGESIALALSNEGATIIVNDVDADCANKVVKKINALGKNAFAIPVDASDVKKVDEMVNEVIQRFGKIDILVNNVGVGPRKFDFLDIDEREWDRLFMINVKSHFLCCKAVIPYMIKQRYGKIVNAASIVGKMVFPKPWDGEIFAPIHYCASKFAVIGLTQGLAIEYAKYNINVNAYCPGVVWTPHMWGRALQNMSKKEGVSKEDVKKKYEEIIPLGRPQETEDIARLVVFLCSEDSKNITGQAVNVNGGQLLL